MQSEVKDLIHLRLFALTMQRSRSFGRTQRESLGKTLPQDDVLFFMGQVRSAVILSGALSLPKGAANLPTVVVSQTQAGDLDHDCS